MTTPASCPQPPRHIAIIMDGNGRWATERALPRSAGHRAGAEAVHSTVSAAVELSVEILTLYAFSSDNWNRPDQEVALLLSLFEDFLRDRTAECRRQGVRLSIIGRRDRLPESLVRSIESSQQKTSSGERLHLRLAIDYSSRDAILEAATLAQRPLLDRSVFARLLASATHAGRVSPDVDLLIRTGREQRLSDFLLWECAYAELIFFDTLWPDFTGDDLRSAVAEFNSRERRFGSLPNESLNADPTLRSSR